MKTYLVPEINKIYTDKIAEYMNQGYTIHTNTMGGSQGEVASIHLMSPNRRAVLRVSLDHFSDWKSCRDGYEINIKRYPTSKLHNMYDLSGLGDVLWDSEGKLVTTQKFYMISKYKKNFFGDEEAYKKAQEIHMKRFYGPKAINITDRTCYTKDITSPKVVKAVMPWVKRQYKCSSAIPRDITKVIKCIDYRQYEDELKAYPYYEITVRNSIHRLAARGILFERGLR